MEKITECFDNYISKQKAYIAMLKTKNENDFSIERKEYISILEKNLENDKNAIDEIVSMQYKFFHHFYGRTLYITGVSQKENHLIVKQGKQKARYIMHITEVINNIFTK